MLLISGLVLGLVVVVGIAKLFADRYHTTTVPSGKVLRTFGLPDGQRRKLPTLSVVIPCFNEEARLPAMLADCVAFVRNTLSSSTRLSGVEILVVDDCSTDRTVEVAKAFFEKENSAAGPDKPAILWSIVPVRPNHGKGFAVRSGFFASSGDLVLMADGDNATRFADVEKLIDALEANSVDVVVGSRAHLEKRSIATRTIGRTMLMKAFHAVVSVTYFIGTLGSVCAIRDTQCGFKLFRRLACEKLFLNNRLERWAFDVEVLLLAKRFRMPVVEVPVTWQEIPGSKVRLSGMVQMGLECVLMCFAYPFGLWPVMTAPRVF